MRMVILLLVVAYAVAVLVILLGPDVLRWKHVEAGLVNGGLPVWGGWLLGRLIPKLYGAWKNRKDSSREAA